MIIFNSTLLQCFFSQVSIRLDVRKNEKGGHPPFSFLDSLPVSSRFEFFLKIVA